MAGRTAAREALQHLHWQRVPLRQQRLSLIIHQEMNDTAGMSCTGGVAGMGHAQE